MVAAVLANPRYTGRQVWNRQPSQAVLVDPADTGLGHRQVQRWNLSEGWVIEPRPDLGPHGPKESRCRIRGIQP